MTIQEAKKTVVQAGKKLVETGLIARTWGNVSCRISDKSFVITPSGRNYLTLTPEDIVEVSIADCSYSGNIKPSSEKGIHAEVYKLHPEVHFVIHTHQDYASAVSVLPSDSFVVPNHFPSLGGRVLSAGYGLPGTKKLRRRVAESLTQSNGKAVIMKHHGALCFGADYEEAFSVAHQLEDACQQLIREQYLKVAGVTDPDPIQMGYFALSKLTGTTVMKNVQNQPQPCESRRAKNGFQMRMGGKTYDIQSGQLDRGIFPDKVFLEKVAIHREIYQSNQNVNHIIHTCHDGIQAVSCAKLKLFPLLDDFAQIAGSSVKTVERDAAIISAALKKASAVLIKNEGALCCGSTKGDAQAVNMVVEKNCNALISAALFGSIQYIHPLECRLMRLIYLKKYSKQAAAEA